MRWQCLRSVLIAGSHFCSVLQVSSFELAGAILFLLFRVLHLEAISPAAISGFTLNNAIRNSNNGFLHRIPANDAECYIPDFFLHWHPDFSSKNDLKHLSNSLSMQKPKIQKRICTNRHNGSQISDAKPGRSDIKLGISDAKLA